MCKICDREFVTPNALERHSYLHKSLNFTCTVCDLGFPFRSSLESHMLSHTMDKKHKCTKCPKSFISKDDLTKHLKVHSKKIWRCSMCTYTSKDERNLKAHHRKHSNLRQYIYSLCLKLFKYHTQLKRHLPCKNARSPKSEDAEPKPKLRWSNSEEY